MPLVDEKISDLAAAIELALNDLLVAVDRSDTSMAASGTDKKVTLELLVEFLHPHLATQLINEQAGDYTPVLSDVGKLIVINSATDVEFELPETATVAIPIGGWMEVIQLGVGVIQFVPEGGIASYQTTGAGARVKLQVIDTDTWHMSGALETV